MNETATRIAVAATLLWLGMVLAISFMEAPLKFRTPGLELRTGLAIGRIVFRALNRVEVGWGVVVAVFLIVRGDSALTTTIAAAVAIAALAFQLAVVRPRLNRRTDQVLAGNEAPRSSAHHLYIAAEVIKVMALIALSVALLDS